MRQSTLPRAFVLAALLTIFGNAQPRPNDEQAIQTLIKTFAKARNVYNGEAVAALYSADGEWLSRDGRDRVRGKTELARLWSGVRGQVQRTVQSIDFPGANIAVVRVITQYQEPQHREVFVMTKDHDRWSIRLHQSVD